MAINLAKGTQYLAEFYKVCGWCKAGMHNSDFMAGQKNVADTFAGQIG
jgi:hypothetical protein